MRQKAISKIIPGGLAQLARAPALHAGGQLNCIPRSNPFSPPLEKIRLKIRQTSLIEEINKENPLTWGISSAG